MKKKTIVFLSLDCASLAVAEKLIEEGIFNVIFGVGRNPPKDINMKQEEKEISWEIAKSRLGDYAVEAEKLVEKLTNKNPDDFVIFADFNSLFYLTEKLQKSGFWGLLPTKEDFLLERDRELAKKLVEKTMPDLKLANVVAFQKIDEAIKFLNEDGKNTIWVLKGNHWDAPTIVPETTNYQFANEAIVSSLIEYQKNYEKEGFILEKYIYPKIEYTPEAIIVDGKVIAITLDIESKKIGNKETGFNVGCAGNLILKINENSELYKIAIAPQLNRFKNKRGIYFVDASVLVQESEDKLNFYFGEFCANRPGYDSWFTEIKMAEDASNFFASLIGGVDPFLYICGGAIRLFDLEAEVVPYFPFFISFKEEVKENTFLYGARKIRNEKYLSVPKQHDIMSVCLASNNVETVFPQLYSIIKEGVYFKNMYYRTDFEEVSMEPQIMYRFEYGIKKSLFNLSE